MSCKDHTTRDALIQSLQGSVICATCESTMVHRQGAIAFGNDMLTTWCCEKCHAEEMLVIREDGSVLKFIDET